jgi:hypothetical protein
MAPIKKRCRKNSVCTENGTRTHTSLGHMALNHACLPIPAPRYIGLKLKSRGKMPDFLEVTWLGLEPRTTSLKGRCSTN